MDELYAKNTCQTVDSLKISNPGYTPSWQTTSLLFHLRCEVLQFILTALRGFKKCKNKQFQCYVSHCEIAMQNMRNLKSHRHWIGRRLTQEKVRDDHSKSYYALGEDVIRQLEWCTDRWYGRYGRYAAICNWDVLDAHGSVPVQLKPLPGSRPTLG